MEAQIRAGTPYVRIFKSIAHDLHCHIKLKYAQTGAILHRACHVQIATLGESYMCDFAPPLLLSFDIKLRLFVDYQSLPVYDSNSTESSQFRVELVRTLWRTSLHFLLSF